ncbi:MAG: DUF4249 domain-containing protein, partial [Bacteroidales bacterium]|nr:DUF4249 domain-containing protein [Bacteroidales bacterium]
MTLKKLYIYPILVFVVVTTACITPFSPKGIEAEEDALVIEGDIIIYGETKVYLSLLRTLDSDYDVIYVTHAHVWIENQQGDVYTGYVAEETNDSPHFVIDTRTLSLDAQYKLCVHLWDGRQYESDFLTPLATPDIHAIGFTVHDTRTAVDFHVTTYGDDHNSRFYKWNYTEDWEIISPHYSGIYFDPVLEVFRRYPGESPVYYCWKRAESTAVIARTDHLEENTVYQYKLHTMTNRDDRISFLYFIELHQMSISKEAHVYWSVLKRNTDEIGGIFAPQPSELRGNIRCISHPDDRVFGYISAGTRSVEKIFVTAQDIG